MSVQYHVENDILQPPYISGDTENQQQTIQCGPMSNVMVALPNIGGASVQRRKDWLTPTTRCRAVTLPRRETS